MPHNTFPIESIADEITVEDDETLLLTLENQLELEYNCQTPSELSLANIASVGYLHYLDIQKQMQDCTSRINALYYSHNSCEVSTFHPYIPNNACKRSQFELQRFSILSKELDRAYRQYLNSLNMLRMMKQAPLQITVKAQTAIVGQNQVVQSNNHG